MRIAGAVAVAGLAIATYVSTPAAQTGAQSQTAPPAPQATFRAATNLVEVDVVVLDKEGRFIPGLTVEDLEVFEDGKRQSVQQFYLVTHVRGGATFYTIFGRGSDGVGGRTTDVVTAEPSTVTTHDTAEDGAEILAAGTGGFVVRNLNDVSRALGLVARDTSNYYVMGYQPDNTVMDGKVRRIEVRPRTTELRVRARKGYVASPLPQMQNIKIGGG